MMKMRGELIRTMDSIFFLKTSAFLDNNFSEFDKEKEITEGEIIRKKWFCNG